VNLAFIPVFNPHTLEVTWFKFIDDIYTVASQIADSHIAESILPNPILPTFVKNDKIS